MLHNRTVSVIGLGYVGLLTAAAFGQKTKVIALDKDPIRIAELVKYFDRNHEVTEQALKSANVYFTTDPDALKQATFHIVAVPTPLDSTKHPDLSALIQASETIGKRLKKGDIVVYESTVYPGATEEKCIPMLEEASKLKCGKDFGVGFSPERINPGDDEHTFNNIVKIVSATDNATLEIIARVYEAVVQVGVHRVSNIRVAEATKIIENTQRDINISFMNEMTVVLHALNIDTKEVIAAMKTKWNFVPFKPGLVGGHCIGNNTYYLLHKAEQKGIYPELMMTARHVNETISKYIVQAAIQQLSHLGVLVKGARIAILGLTYKENCSDLRDTRIMDLIKEFKPYEVKILIHDPLADPREADEKYGVKLEDWDNLNDLDAIILAVAHKQYRRISKTEFKKILNNRGLIMDIKELLNPKDFEDTRITIWQL